jgi:hypothetical protein
MSVLWLALTLGGGVSAHAQLVTPKTVPIHQDNQFAIFPSSRSGMADVGLALDDTLGDPFANPAKAAVIRSGVLFTNPYSHGVSSGAGGGNTFPVGGFAAFGDWTGSAVFAVQQLNHGRGIAIADRTASNQYGSVVLARRLPNGVSVGGSAYVAGLNAVDGVDLLYQGNDRLVQSGTLSDFRLGMTKAWDRRRIEFVVLHNRTNMTQDVHYTTTIFNPPNASTTTQRSDHNIDRTHIWGAHTQYVQAVGENGWRIGWLATANRLSHPKIPNYQIQNIPRDPGTTYGFNVGAGAARTIGRTSFGVDVIEEPMFSDTWGTAERDTAIVGGGLIRAGDRTVSNRFTFSNAKIRAGMEHDFVGGDSTQGLGLQLGLIAYAINYRLRQTNHVQRTDRVQDEGWTEWTPTFGLRWHTKDFELQYTYRRTCGPSDCVSIGMGDKVTVPGPGGIIAAPSSPLSIDGGTAHTHRFVMSVPIR